MGASNDPDSDGWTTIVRGGRKPTRPAPIGHGPALDKSITLADLQWDFDKHIRVWKRSICRKNLLRMLRESHIDAISEIMTAVCLASGRFSTLNVEANRRAMLQFACFVDVAGEIGRLSGEAVQLFAQEPQYSEVDKALCADKGVTILDAELDDSGLGQARALLGPQTVLFEFFMDMGAEGFRNLLRADVGVYIGSSFLRHSTSGRLAEKKLDEEGRAEVESSRRAHVQKWFPEFGEEEGVFKGLAVYWREERDDDLEEGAH